MAQCEATTKSGKQCSKQARQGAALCEHHDGTINHAMAGRKGGAVFKKIGQVGNLRMSPEMVQQIATDELRQKATRVFNDALESDDRNMRLSAAKALYSVASEKPVNEAQKKGWQTEHAGVDAREVARILKQAYGDQPIEILPSPGEVLSTRAHGTSDRVSSSRGS